MPWERGPLAARLAEHATALGLVDVGDLERDTSGESWIGRQADVRGHLAVRPVFDDPAWARS